jgi:hypothetical protein
MGTQGEIFRGVLSYTHPAGSINQNVFTWELQEEDTSDAEILASIETWVQDEWGDAWDGWADSGALLYLLEVDVLNNNGTVKRNIGEEIQATVGTVAGDVMPAAVSGFFQADTERPKSFGRKYVPCMAENHGEEGTVSSAGLGLLVLLLLATVADIPTGIEGVLAAGVLSRVTELFLEFTGGGYATDIPAYQRSRKPNVGS